MTRWARKTASKLLSAWEEKPKHWDEISLCVDEKYLDHNGHAHYTVREEFGYEALRAYLDKRGMPLEELETKFGKLLFLVHEEGYHFGEIFIGDTISVSTGVAEIGNTSITVHQVFRRDSRIVKWTKKVGVMLHAADRTKCRVPDELRLKLLSKH